MDLRAWRYERREEEKVEKLSPEEKIRESIDEILYPGEKQRKRRAEERQEERERRKKETPEEIVKRIFATFPNHKKR